MQTAARAYTACRPTGCYEEKINVNGRALATGFFSGLLCAYYGAHNSLATFTNRLNDVQIINCGKIPSIQGVSRVKKQKIKHVKRSVDKKKKKTMVCIL